MVHPAFDPVAFQIGPLAVRWYGLMYLIGFALIWIAGRYRIKRRPGGVWTPKDSAWATSSTPSCGAGPRMRRGR
jgi:prolipoprotein diacylglyceryltransferase